MVGLNRPQELISFIDHWTWGTTLGIFPRTYNPMIEALIQVDKEHNFFMLLAHYAKTQKAQDGIENLGGVITSNYTAPHFRYGDKAIKEIQHHLGIVTNLYAFGTPFDGKLNIFLAPLSKSHERALRRVIKWDSNKQKVRCPINKLGKIVRLLHVGSVERPPFSLNQLVQELGEENSLLVDNGIRTDADVQKNLYWLSNKYRFCVI